jgi:hypothetical protein
LQPKEEKPFYQKPYVVQLTSDPNKIAAAPMYYAPAPDANMTESRRRERTRNSYEEKKKELASRDTFKSVEKAQRKTFLSYVLVAHSKLTQVQTLPRMKC